ncbi:unnamed protein product [Cuscuta campestris]|uniref:pectinesterase n=1 Tax=Cuscuta campestris TaxID=132261 RepID=A0A484KFB4_9ASTE|nr:unnamed protein product [Cuscuta campestris]
MMSSSSPSSNVVAAAAVGSSSSQGGGAAAAAAANDVTFKADVVVSPNPSIAEALATAPPPPAPFGIHVMAGTYEEYVTISRSNVTLFGDGIGNTIITGKRNRADGPTTSDTATLIVEGVEFIGAYMTVRNTAGMQKEQAVAMRASANHVAFYKCSFEGYQDTLYPEKGNQFYKECQIYGTIDFIFSQSGRVVLQDCGIHVRDPRPKTTNTITADGRDVPDDISGGGICIHRCQISATPELLRAMAEEEAAHGSIESYLGRPWKKYARTVIMRTNIEGGFLNPAGWTKWPGAPDDTYNTVYYAEYQNSGDGAATDGRVPWKGYIRDGFDPSKFTVAAFIDGNSWLPKTGIPFTPGLQDDDEPAAAPHPSDSDPLSIHDP